MTNATASISGRNDNPPLLLYGGGVGFDEVRQLADDINVMDISRTRSHWKSWMLESRARSFAAVIWTPHSR
jgi:hypothetical protein